MRRKKVDLLRMALSSIGMGFVVAGACWCWWENALLVIVLDTLAKSFDVTLKSALAFEGGPVIPRIEDYLAFIWDHTSRQRWKILGASWYLSSLLIYWLFEWLTRAESKEVNDV